MVKYWNGYFTEDYIMNNINMKYDIWIKLNHQQHRLIKDIVSLFQATITFLPRWHMYCFKILIVKQLQQSEHWKCSEYTCTLKYFFAIFYIYAEQITIKWNLSNKTPISNGFYVVYLISSSPKYNTNHLLKLFQLH